MSDWVLALDIGTSSSRAIVFDSNGHAVLGLRSQEEYRLSRELDGKAEIHPTALIEAVARCIDTVMERAGSQSHRFGAVGICTFWHSMVGVDRLGVPITPLYTWADTRAASDAVRLQDILNPEEYHARVGCALHPSFFPARLAWLARANHTLFQSVSRWLSPGELLFLELFGETGCSLSMASASGLLNQHTSDWDPETLEVLGCEPRHFAPLIDLGHVYTGLRSEWEERWPALASLPWVPAIGDGAASNLGSGCATEARMAINLGTSGAIRVMWQKAESDPLIIPDELWCYRLDSTRLTMGGAFSDGGNAYDWARQNLRLPSLSESEAWLGIREPGQHGLTVLPFFGGERSVRWRPESRGTMNGLTFSSTPLDILQAMMEAIALRFVLIADVLGEQFPAIEHVVGSGGALGESTVWSQMICDALGRPLVLSSEAEASSRGAALVALKAAGIIGSESDAPAPFGQTLAPDRERTVIYRALLAEQQALLGSLG